MLALHHATLPSKRIESTAGASTRFFVLPAEGGGDFAAAVLVAAHISGDAKRNVHPMNHKAMKTSEACIAAAVSALPTRVRQ